MAGLPEIPPEVPPPGTDDVPLPDTPRPPPAAPPGPEPDPAPVSDPPAPGTAPPVHEPIQPNGSVQL